jgi:hypothetical protein
MFLDWARRALKEAGTTALRFLADNPQLTQVGLAKQLATHGRVNGIGVVMAIYEEAVQRGMLRTVAKELLLRTIWSRFPSGWSSHGEVHPIVKIGGWSYELKYAKSPKAYEACDRILRHLVNSPPPEGWTPLADNDPLIESLFDQYWPRDSEACSRQSADTM